MAQKTKADSGSVQTLVAELTDASKQADSRTLIDLMQDVTGCEPGLWGTMIGFGSYHYRYESGHEGDTFLIGFAPRKAEFSIYLTGCQSPDIAGDVAQLLSRLGKHHMGKGCLYVKRLSDIDIQVLRQLATLSVEALRRDHPQDA